LFLNKDWEEINELLETIIDITDSLSNITGDGGMDGGDA